MALSAARHAIVAALPGEVIRQSLVPMLALYLILMAALGLGLRQVRREQSAAGLGWQQQQTRPEPWERAAAGDSRGWWTLVRRVGVTVVSGYLLLVAVDLIYYFGVAHVAGNFLESTITGPALLIGLSMPLYAALMWVLARRNRPGPGKGS